MEGVSFVFLTKTNDYRLTIVLCTIANILKIEGLR